MDSGDDIKLYGMWASPYVHRVQLALKLKGLHYEYVEEDLANKSPALLLLNPVHQKVPVFLHGGRPIAESPIILEYIDEAWPHRFPLMPSEPQERAAVRFWCHFADNKLGPSVGAVLRFTGEARKAAIAEAWANAKLLEDELREGFFRGRKFFGGEMLGLLDILLGTWTHWLRYAADVAGADVDEEFPRFGRWIRDIQAVPEVQEVLPHPDRLLQYARRVMSSPA